MALMNRLLNVCWNSQQRRLRAGWRLVLHTNLFIAAAVVKVIIDLISGIDPQSTGVVNTGLDLALVLGVIWLVARFLDRRPQADFGFHLSSGWCLDFGFGVLLGAALMTGIFLTEWLTGWIALPGPSVTESGVALAPAVLQGLGLFFAVALTEEFTFRGYQVRNLSEGLTGRWVGPRTAITVAWLTTSCVFGLVHAANPHATAVSSLNIMLDGVFLGLPYILTGELAISIGLHLSWNFFQGTIYGFPVSGTMLTKRALILEQHGPDLWTGGSFGPEAGLLGIAAAVGGCMLVVAWVKFRYRRIAIDAALAQYKSRASKSALVSSPSSPPPGDERGIAGAAAPDESAS